MSDVIIEARQLTKNYASRCAVDSLDLRLKVGTKLAILGSNGAGKSSLMRMLACLERPSSGSLFILGHDAQKESDALLSHIAYISHKTQLYLNLTARENLELFAKLYSIQHEGEDIETLLDLAHLLHRQHDLVKNFSQGMKQRLSIACAFLIQAQLVLLDEPYVGLDPQGVEMLDTLMSQVKPDTSFVLISHNPQRAYQFADQLIVLQDGIKVVDVLKKDIQLQDFLSLYSKAIFSSAEV